MQGAQPTLADFQTYITNVMGITSQQLSPDDPVIPLVFWTAYSIVNDRLQCIPLAPGAPSTQPALYTQAVYLLAADRLLNWAQDPAGAPIYKDNLPFFAYTRAKLNLTGFVPGVIASTNDLSTGGSYVVPDAFKGLTIRDLQNLKTPYGQAYLGIAQDYGPSEWGFS